MVRNASAGQNIEPKIKKDFFITKNSAISDSSSSCSDDGLHSKPAKTKKNRKGRIWFDMNTAKQNFYKESFNNLINEANETATQW